MRYDPAAIEPKWQKAWEEQCAFRTPSDLSLLQLKPKFYVLDMFPYPSGAGLHVGHPEGYTATDVIARLKRAQGYHVLHPMGWDAFGLPAERAAMRENLHPAAITKRNVDTFRRQIKRLGFSYDWKREINTSDPSYYRWTQWIFLRLFECDLAYRAEMPVNWCAALGTVLANEEVKDGRYVETGDPVERRLMTQWMLRITAYAERLLDDLEGLDWPDGVKEMQRNWIGKSTGADIRFEVADRGVFFDVFTTRPDTLFGATFCVLAPEHPLVSRITDEGRRAEVSAYVEAATARSETARASEEGEKTGVFTGAFALHPVTGARIPIWIADYVLMGYGTGAIMAVPGQDQRDWDFAEKFNLPIVRTVQPPPDFAGNAYLGDGPAINSDFLNGLDIERAKARMIEWLEANGKGRPRVQYRLRDWLFSRQRYWGEPVPIVHLEDGTVMPVPVEQLPVTLPAIDEYRPTADGKPPLARAGDDWLMVTLPDGRKGVRETNTMPQWAGSCWYYLRFIDPHNEAEICAKTLEQYWMPVDLYIGGVEHAVLHLLYARFWHKVLYDCGVVHTPEPFQKLYNQGMILAYSYRDRRGKYYEVKDVEEHEDGVVVAKATGEPLEAQVEKMSKSKLNVVSPDEVIDEYGADAMRLYELFMGPLDQVKPWRMSGVEGVSRFLQRAWRLIVDEHSGALSGKLTDNPGASEPGLWRALHVTIRKVLEDTEGLRFNTAIAQMMIFVNEATASPTLPREIATTFLRVLAPYAPHVAEELWARLGHTGLIASAPWPAHDPELCLEDTITLVVQVNGKLRDRIQVAREADAKTLEECALRSPGAEKTLAGRPPRKVIVVPGRLVNIVV
jgi:leucyl-tRNA synthetase